MAEWRVGQRRMMPGETYAEFAAALRDLCGNNRVRERVLLAQFYRSLDRTTRLLVKQRPKPETLEEAVDKATEINDPIDNVAQGMENIRQAFVTAPETYVVPANGTTGHMALIPGVGSTDVAEGEKLAYFTNSRGVYNKYLGLWEAPKGRVWNGHMWAPVPRKRTAPAAAPTATKRMATSKVVHTAKVNMAVAAGNDYDDESNDGEEADAPHVPPPPKKAKFAARRSKAATRQVTAMEASGKSTVAAPPQDGSVNPSATPAISWGTSPASAQMPKLAPVTTSISLDASRRRSCRKTRIGRRRGITAPGNATNSPAASDDGGRRRGQDDERRERGGGETSCHGSIGRKAGGS
ncbi:hypothetical protein PF010_g20103 [Phytophthora fragariae]|uniref:Uncharacterized protein n=1 Tax=Phytophthora fragariae TaxID=53985 RepID=A0A6G0KFR8_9STRA|nr:hypothetical protein PF010_g20103 [Phytophthora fragariae]